MNQPEFEVMPVESSMADTKPADASKLPMLPGKAPRDFVKVTRVYFNTDVETFVLLDSKLKEVLMEEVPNTPPPHNWYEFAITAVGIGATVITPPFGESDINECWRIVAAGAIVWLFIKAMSAHRMNKSLKRNKSAVVTAIIKKLKNSRES